MGIISWDQWVGDGWCGIRRGILRWALILLAKISAGVVRIRRNCGGFDGCHPGRSVLRQAQDEGGEPGPISRVSRLMNGSRIALRASGMTS